MGTRPKIPRLKMNAECKTTITSINTALEKYFNEADSLENLCHKVYCAATLTCKILKQDKYNSPGGEPQSPPWKKRLETKISNYRKEIGIIHSYLSTQQPSRKLVKKIKTCARKLKVKPGTLLLEQTLIQRAETLKQKIAALGKRLKRYHKRTLRCKQNTLFNNNQRLFFRNLEAEITDEQHELPKETEMTEFWSEIWAENIQHDRKAQWINIEKENSEKYTEMPNITVSKDDVQATVKRMKNWTAPGMDGIHNYWWKALSNSHEPLARLIQNAMRDPNSIPIYFTQGETHMLPKKGDLAKPNNYRPITCLPSAYKILTSILCHKLNCHLKQNNIMSWEQNGCKHKGRGCKELLIIDNIATMQARKRQRNLSVAWIDYQKAFDSVPHSWLMEILKIYKINEQTIDLLRHLMGSWRTTLLVRGNTNSYKTREIPIQRGIFQGDSLSPLWFCLAMNPLSNMLNRSAYGYKIDDRTKLTHLFYMDDLKLYAKSREQLEGQLELVRSFSQGICMRFGLDKCATIHIKRGKLTESADITLADGSEIRNLGAETSYKYLGIQQTYELKQKDNKEQAEKELVRRTNKILKTQLDAKNKFTAYNIWAVPVLTYTAGILTWSKTDLERLDRKIRSLLTKHGILHPNSAIERLYLPRDEGGRGLISLESASQEERQKLRKYLLTNNAPVYKSIRVLDKNYTSLNLASDQEPEAVNLAGQMKQRWQSKELHGRFYASLHQEDVDFKASNTYLTAGYLFPGTEGAILSIQDQVVKTRTYARYILKQQVENTKCRLCNISEESVQHLSSGCSKIAGTRYLERHNNMGKVVHQLVCLNKGLLDTFTPHHMYVPKAVLENNTTKIYWDFTVETDIGVEHNKPDMVIWNKPEKTAIIIDFSVPQDYNVAKAYADKINKYAALSQEIKAIWELRKVIIVPLIISANGLVHKMTNQHIRELNLPNNTIMWMQKAVVLCTVGIIRRIVSSSIISIPKLVMSLAGYRPDMDYNYYY